MLAVLFVLACGGTTPSDAVDRGPQVVAPVNAEVAASHAYAGHADQPDVQALVVAFPDLAGTRLDDCRTCHRPWPGASGDLDACDACHLILHPPPPGSPAAPTSFHDTLGPFGLDYLAAGRNAAAIAAIGERDSDGDGFTNAAEVAARTFPGDATSHPGQAAAPVRTFARADLGTLPRASAFLLVDADQGSRGQLHDLRGGAPRRSARRRGSRRPRDRSDRRDHVRRRRLRAQPRLARGHRACRRRPRRRWASTSRPSVATCGWVRYPGRGADRA